MSSRRRTSGATRRRPAPAVASAASVGFPPIVHRCARVLVLGSLPGRVSLERREYYAQPQNAFWRIVESLFGIPRELPYARRTRALAVRGIAVWDVCAAAERPGSLDSDIRLETVVPNDFATLFRRHRAIGTIAFNGAKAAELYRRLVLEALPDEFANHERIVLPSTSPANAGLAFAAKLERWRVVERALDGGRASKS